MRWCRSADVRWCRSADVDQQMWDDVDQQMCGWYRSADVWWCRSADVWWCRSADVWWYRSVDMLMYYHADEKTRYPNVRNWASHVSFIWVFPWKRPKKLDTQMSGIKHPMSFFSRFFHEHVKKSSIPKCQKLSIPCQFYMFFSMKTSKKARYPNVRN